MIKKFVIYGILSTIKVKLLRSTRHLYHKIAFFTKVKEKIYSYEIHG